MKQELYNEFLIHYFEEIDSTNSYLKNLIDQGLAQEFGVVTANRQTAGRGRKSRKWQSFPENLHFSVCLQPKIDPKYLPQISLISVLALANVVNQLIEKSSDLEIFCKWPNDLLINDKKVSGILLETIINNNSNCDLIIGCGVNIAKNPEQTIFPAGNLQDFGIYVSKDKLLKSYLDELKKLYQSWLNFGFNNFRILWLKQAYKINQDITINIDDNIIDGEFIDIDNFGNMLLKCEDGQIKKIEFAEIL